jgi:hypothetical protein
VTSQPLYVARYGVFLALGAAIICAWLTHRSGNALDVSLMRSVFVFVLFTGLGFGAEAVIVTAPRRIREPAPHGHSVRPHRTEPSTEPNEDEVNQ